MDEFKIANQRRMAETHFFAPLTAFLTRRVGSEFNLLFLGRFIAPSKVSDLPISRELTNRAHQLSSRMNRKLQRETHLR